jgi:transcriptional regulator GlxA family with amidase domain
MRSGTAPGIAACFRLSESSHGLNRIATECGYGSADVMRQAFLRVMRVNPEDYRARFRSIAPPSHIKEDARP